MHARSTTPNIDKTLVGEILGSNKEFDLQVLEAYLGTFKMSCDFLGVLRTFLESFKVRNFRLCGCCLVNGANNVSGCTDSRRGSNYSACAGTLLASLL